MGYKLTFNYRNKHYSFPIEETELCELLDDNNYKVYSCGEGIKLGDNDLDEMLKDLAQNHLNDVDDYKKYFGHPSYISI